MLSRHAILAPLVSLLGLASPAAPQDTGGLKAFTGVTLVDGTDRTPVVNATLLVRNGRVVAAGPASQVPVPPGAERINLTGKVIIPGLVNAHGHVNAVGELGTYAAYGVTTVVSLGGEPETVFAARAERPGAARARARVYVAGPVITATTADSARRQVAENAARSVDVVKIRVDDNLGTAAKMPADAYRAVIDDAHRRGLRVAAHVYYLADAMALVAAGADFIAHSVRDTVVDDAFVRALRGAGTCYSPTLMREVSTFVYESTPEFFGDTLFLRHANREWLNTLREPARQREYQGSASAQRYRAQLPVAMRNLRTLSDAGVMLAMGTDTGPFGRFQGYFELMELELMVRAGLTPRQALAAATRDAARCMRIDGEVGTLEPGKWADFLVLDASPLDDLANIRRIVSVWIAGNPVAR